MNIANLFSFFFSNNFPGELATTNNKNKITKFDKNLLLLHFYVLLFLDFGQTKRPGVFGFK